MQAADLVCNGASQLLALASCSPPESKSFRNIKVSFADLEAVQKARCFYPKAKEPEGTRDGGAHCRSPSRPAMKSVQSSRLCRNMQPK